MEYVSHLDAVMGMDELKEHELAKLTVSESKAMIKGLMDRHLPKKKYMYRQMRMLIGGQPAQT